MIAELGHQVFSNWQDLEAEVLGTLQILGSGSSWILSDTSVHVGAFSRKYSLRQRDREPNNHGGRYESVLFPAPDLTHLRRNYYLATSRQRVSTFTTVFTI